MIKEEVESVEDFREAQERSLLGTGVRRRRRVRFEVEGVEIGVSGFRREKLLFTGTEENN